jgi:hypothetical protein
MAVITLPYKYLERLTARIKSLSLSDSAFRLDIERIRGGSSGVEFFRPADLFS